MNHPQGPEFWAVYCWNFDHTRRKIFANYHSEAEALDICSALKRHGIESEIVAIGDDDAQPRGATA